MGHTKLKFIVAQIVGVFMFWCNELEFVGIYFFLNFLFYNVKLKTSWLNDNMNFFDIFHCILCLSKKCLNLFYFEIFFLWYYNYFLIWLRIFHNFLFLVWFVIIYFRFQDYGNTYQNPLCLWNNGKCNSVQSNVIV